MRSGFLVAWLAVLTSLTWAQNPEPPAKPGADQPLGSISKDSHLKDMFESKIKAEWEALKNKDKKTYGDLLADDYEGVEVDGRGERTKSQALNELDDTNVVNYTLGGYKLIPLSADAAFVIYESTVQFPPKSTVRFSRVYITELWVKRAGEWKEVHYQETHVK